MAAQEDPLIGLQLEEYVIERPLGEGSMARVYRARDTRLNRPVALKLIDMQYGPDSNLAMRLQREARAIEQLDHPHIVRLYRLGSAEGQLYLAMQLVDGVDFETILQSYGTERAFVPPEDASRIIRQVCRALDYAHSQGIIHRDVKPSNILLDRLGRAVLADFGLALIRVIGTSGHVLGTPHYIAPEQFVSSASVTPQTDLYAVGVILYRIFTGHYPFTGNTPLEIATKRLAEAPIPPTDLRPDLSRDVAAVILKAMALEPEARYPDGLALADALDEALQLPGPLRANTDPVREELRAVNRMLGEMAEQLAALNRQFVAQEQRLFDLQLSVQDLIERANVERTDET